MSVAMPCVSRAQDGTALPHGKSALVLLRIAPHVGDTLWTRIEQQMEMTGIQHRGGADSATSYSQNMLLLSHVLVEASDDMGVTVLAVTDSIAMSAAGPRTVATPESARRALQGKKVRLHITPQGSASVVESPDQIGSDLQSVMSGMPGTLPRQPVAVGAHWSQTLSLPLLAGSDPHASASLHATYRFDSLSHDGNIAFVSMRGEIVRDSSVAPLAAGYSMSSNGTVTGSLQVDRKRGWWCDSRTVIAVHSVFTPPPDASAGPLKVETRVQLHIAMARP
jgi:hypothetical protein